MLKCCCFKKTFNYHILIVFQPKNKCTSLKMFHEKDQYTSWQEARGRCKAQGGDLAMAKNIQELREIQELIDLTASDRCAYVGLQNIPMGANDINMLR